MILKLVCYVETEMEQSKAEEIKILLEKSLNRAIMQTSHLSDQNLREDQNDNYYEKSEIYREFHKNLRDLRTIPLSQAAVLEKMRTKS